MEMSINFKKLFNFQDSTSNTPSTTSLENSYHIDEPSIISTQSNHINIHYKFNEALFFDSSQDHDQNINILEDLSSIGRSFEEDEQREPQMTPMNFGKQQQNLQKTYNSSNYHYQKQCKPQQTFYLNEKDTTKSPGERLYYESKIQNQRKIRQIERIKMELQQQQSKEVTFKPAINEKSKKILQLADSPLRKLENMKKHMKNQQSKKQSLMELKSTAEKKQEEELKNCTFKPTILKTPKSLITTPQGRSSSNKDLSNVFDSLYNEHRAKIERQRKLLEKQQNQRRSKASMLGKEQLQEFFNRNAEYIQEKKHREELLKAVSSQYDLTSGRKLFQPKINTTLGQGMVGSLSMAKFNATQLQHQVEQNCNKTPKANKQCLNSSKSSNKTMYHSNSNIRNNKTELSKMMQTKGKQMIITSNGNNDKGEFKAKPYQLSKFPHEIQLNHMQSQLYNQQNHDEDCQQHNVQRQFAYAPKSSIFNKGSIAQSLFETNEEEEAQQLQSDDDKFMQKQQEQHQDKQLQIYDCNKQADSNKIHIYEENIVESQFIDVQQQVERNSYENVQEEELNLLEQNETQNDNKLVNVYDDVNISADKLQYVEDEHYYEQNNDQDFAQSNLPHNLTNSLFPNESQQSKPIQSQQQHQFPLLQQCPQPQTILRKSSEDNDSTQNRANFLQSIVKNPFYSHKYHDLFALQSTQPQYQQPTLDPHTVQQHISNCHQQQISSIIANQPLFRPLFLAKDSEEQENQQKPSNKSWHEIFTASTQIDKTKTIPPSESGLSERSKVSEIKPNSNLSPEESPKKKAINIASLLKAKKKQVPKQ